MTLYALAILALAQTPTSTHPHREFAQGEYTVHVLPAMAHTRDVSILFWDGTISPHILRSDHPPLDTATAAVLFPQAHRPVRLALTEANSDVDPGTHPPWWVAMTSRDSARR